MTLDTSGSLHSVGKLPKQNWLSQLVKLTTSCPASLLASVCFLSSFGSSVCVFFFLLFVAILKIDTLSVALNLD